MLPSFLPSVHANSLPPLSERQMGGVGINAQTVLSPVWGVCVWWEDPGPFPTLATRLPVSRHEPRMVCPRWGQNVVGNRRIVPTHEGPLRLGSAELFKCAVIHVTQQCGKWPCPTLQNPKSHE